jgi:hypothetical protein
VFEAAYVGLELLPALNLRQGDILRWRIAFGSFDFGSAGGSYIGFPGYPENIFVAGQLNIRVVSVNDFWLK